MAQRPATHWHGIQFSILPAIIVRNKKKYDMRKHEYSGHDVDVCVCASCELTSSLEQVPLSVRLANNIFTVAKNATFAVRRVQWVFKRFIFQFGLTVAEEKHRRHSKPLEKNMVCRGDGHFYGT